MTALPHRLPRIGDRLPSRGVALHAARIGGGLAAPAVARGGGEAAFRPVGPDLDDVAAAAQLLDRLRRQRGPRPPARRAAPRAARTTTGNARSARPARRSPPAGSCRNGRGAGRTARSIGPAGRRRASPRRGTARRRAAPWWATASCAAACRARARWDGPRRARTAARACRGRSRAPGSPATIAASRPTASTTPCCRARSMMSKCTVSPRMTPALEPAAVAPATRLGSIDVVVRPGHAADRRLAGAGRGDALAARHADVEPHAVARDVARPLLQRGSLADELAARVVVGVRQQHLARHLHEIRIAVERLAVGEGELGAFDHGVDEVRRWSDRRRRDRSP